MSVRRDPVGEAANHGRAQLERILADARSCRLAAGLPLSRVAKAVGCSRQRLATLERGRFSDVGALELARLAGAVGLDLSMRVYSGGPALRDAGQLRLLARFRAALGDAPWQWRTEVPVSTDAHDRRAIDALLIHQGRRVGVEAITMLLDAGGQVRPILLKQEAAGLSCVILVISDTRHNREAVAAAGPTLDPAFPLRQRAEVLGDLRAGRVPAGNAAMLL